MPTPEELNPELAHDEAVDKIANTLRDAIGYADSFEARDMARHIVADGLLQWEQDDGTSEVEMTHERRDELITEALGIAPGETLRIELEP